MTMASVQERVLSPSWFSLDTFQILQYAVVLGFVAVLGKLITFYFRTRELNKSFTSFPGPPCHWLYGNAHELRTDGTDLDTVVSWANEYPYGFRVWFGNFFPTLFVTHPDYAKTVFGRSEPKDWTYSCLEPWIGKGLLLLSGPKWLQHRKLLTPAFHYDILKPYTKQMSECTKIMLDKWEKFANENKPVELFQHVSLMTLDSIMKCAFGCNSNLQNEGDSAYIKAIYDLCSLVDLRFRWFLFQSNLIFYLSPQGFHFRKACKLAHQHTDEVIKQRKAALANENELEKIQQKRHLDFLDILLCAKDENGKGLSDKDLRCEVDTFMFEGHDTTASGISWILYCLAKYPEHQEKCREEIQEILGDRDTMEWADLSQLNYTTMCIKESMRMYPPVPVVSRLLTKPITFFDGRSLPEGSVIMLNIYAIHKNPSVWPDPEVFDPLRFSPENSSGRHSHAFVPFAAGGRNCIGQNFAMNEMKVATALTLQRFQVSPDETRPPIKIPQLVMKSMNGIHLYLKKI
ncbi:cytochrome P450 4B1 [Microcaecilia unicolor]|uniref:Cytochrome P450 4B1-like n=1 Tax=Microcaecilia unicolor TaxID=1415580 RepID=A0A6P7YG09_9AMPH|nr:cytochrome P450 4B1-like [Microcaecilia unicolor]